MITIHSLDELINIQQYNNLTYWQYVQNNDISDRTVIYNPDMFLNAIKIGIAGKGFIYAVNEKNDIVSVLAFDGGTYAHRYVYTGWIDTTFIDKYDCVFLYDCNEYSVELCRRVLNLWRGNRLVLVGHNWEQMIEYLDDISDVECFYEPEVNEKEFAELASEHRCLHIIYGLPHEEKIDRYNEGIMYYDEIMALTFMFSDYRNMGELNPDKKFFIMDGYYNKLGLFTIRSKVEVCLRYAKSKGMIPVVNLIRSGNSFYSDYSGDDIWGKFFNQPEIYTLDEVMNSKHVYVAPGFYNGSVLSYEMEQEYKGGSLSWTDGLFNNRLREYVERRKTMYLPYPDKTLGVLARGTDFVNTHLHNHQIHADKELLARKIDEALDEWKLEYVYISTEDASYYEYFSNRYKNKAFFTDQVRYVTKENELLSDIHNKNENKRNGFELGAEYAASINLLSQCNSFIASGKCSGVSEALRENGGRYKNVYVFELGVNE